VRDSVSLLSLSFFSSPPLSLFLRGRTSSSSFLASGPQDEKSSVLQITSLLFWRSREIFEQEGGSRSLMFFVSLVLSFVPVVFSSDNDLVLMFLLGL